MNSKYENMSLKEIIRQIEKKDKRIAELEKKVSDMNDTIRTIGNQNRKLKRNNERYQERLTEVLYKGEIKNYLWYLYQFRPGRRIWDVEGKDWD